ncbi:MAG: peptide chain release factor N(5)-glutamine methyltransferase [Acidimicrobiaceae bacterium]|nr:peptide chain release factor N(5)-glutamine methyltransferase [Acidimicrobiaceae bacterium]
MTVDAADSALTVDAAGVAMAAGAAGVALTVGTVRWSELFAEAVARFKRAGIDTALIDAQRVVEEITGVRPSGVHGVLNDLVTTGAMARFDEMVARRERGEPLQYVLGRWGFRTLDLMVDKRVLIPRPETEVVAGLAINAVDEVLGTKSRAVGDAGGSAKVADLGTGSGAIALSIAVECPGARVYATDVSKDALAVARANLAGIGSAARSVSLHHGDWFEALPDELQGTLDVVVSNPPYVSESEGLPAVVADWEPPTALWADSEGFADLRSIVTQAPRWLAPRGVVVLEMSPPQTSTVQRWCRDLGWQATVHPDLNGRPRAVVARR